VDTEQQPTTYPCPTCRRGRGRPRSVICQEGKRTIRLVCDTCEYEWDDVSMDAPGLFAPPTIFSGGGGGPDPLL
jgi:hypothetical protein